jgi:uncharacterized membrane protein YkvA (DUF1232 family)
LLEKREGKCQGITDHDKREERKRSELRLFEKIKARAHRLKRDIVALYLAAKDPRTPWYAKALVLCIVAYALSPIDLIPDFVPVLGLIDDLLLLPLGIYIAINLTPTPVLTDCRQRAAAMDYKLPKSWIAAAVIISIWIAAAAALAFYVWQSLYESANPAVLFGHARWSVITSLTRDQAYSSHHLLSKPKRPG